ncbi:hypothetical protein K8352_17660 [Flavobacteriaceae bacterium F89]|uniref:Glycosyltransferase n=1 Tax=Cerina litoralis TaxID=2874477 RepID=A0AAE3EXB3_9FLAO|nr:hypothetical protein [Cerina litoralis]
MASIRNWYPEIPIYLIKDVLTGEFNTKKIEKNFNVSIANFPIKNFGWGISKLEPYFIEEKIRCLILDSDIVFLGKVLDYLDKYEEDFVVSKQEVKDCNTDWFKRTYYNIVNIQDKIDRTFEYKGYVFNTGQIVCNTGKYSRSDFEKFIDWKEPPIVKNSEVFSCADQGILNYYLPTQENSMKISIGKANFMIWGNSPLVKELDFDIIKNREGYPKLIHWAGGIRDLKKLNGSDILLYYQKLYYNRILFGKFKRSLFNLRFAMLGHLKQINRKHNIKTRLRQKLNF